MRAGNKIPFIKQWVGILLLLFSSLIKAGSIENETTNYTISISSENCFFILYLNDLQIISGKWTTPVSTGFTIGEYLKPTNNILKLEVWDPESEPGQWREDAQCEVYIQTFDPVKKLGPEVFADISFYPTREPDLTKPEKLFRHITLVDTFLGKSRTPPNVSYSPDTGRYTLTREFDVWKGFIEWGWYRSPELLVPLPKEQLQKLQEAYKQIWQTLATRDISVMRTLYHEMMYESAMANGSLEDTYFDSTDLQKYFEDELLNKFVLMPLNFEERSFKYSLDRKVVQMEPSPLLFCPEEHTDASFDLRRCYKINPKFRFDGDKFIITR